YRTNNILTSSPRQTSIAGTGHVADKGVNLLAERQCARKNRCTFGGGTFILMSIAREKRAAISIHSAGSTSVARHHRISAAAGGRSGDWPYLSGRLQIFVNARVS